MAERKIIDEGICAIEGGLEGKKEDWKGGGRWAPGLYTWELMGFEPAKNENTGESSLRAWCKCLKAPESQEGRVGQEFGEFFSLSTKGDNPAVNFLTSFMATLTPGGYVNDKEKCVERDGRWYPVFEWITGGPNGRGAIFEAAIEDNTYVVPRGKDKGKEKTNSRFNRGSIKLLEPSSYHKERRGADVSASSSTGGNATGASEQKKSQQAPVGWGAPAT